VRGYWPIILVLALISFACASEIASTQWKFDSNIRALTLSAGDEVWWAGSGGLVGHRSGETWTVDTLRRIDGSLPEFRSIAVTNKAAFVFSIASPAMLYRKLHSSEDWSVVYTNTDSLVFYDSMHFWDDREGIAIGDPLNGCLSVVITRDGGAKWTEVTCDVLPPAEEAAFAASNGNIVLFGDEVWVASGGVKSRIFRSSDRGRTWGVVETPILQGGVMTGLFSVARCGPDQGMGWGGNWEAMADNSANKIVTVDGGASWDLLTPGSGPGYRSCVQYVPNTNCQSIWAVGISGISRSFDGGVTWTNEADSSFYTVRFTQDGETAWLAGRGKVVCRQVYP
tara:strand:+ start:6601 stop:7617 length:1017 start_codon:yes stop_codon:yes gene_type:complete